MTGFMDGSKAQQQFLLKNENQWIGKILGRESNPSTAITTVKLTQVLLGSDFATGLEEVGVLFFIPIRPTLIHLPLFKGIRLPGLAQLVRQQKKGEIPYDEKLTFSREMEIGSKP